MSRVLQGIRVLESSNFVSGPYACQMLAEYGADVLKIENPKGGDPFRSFSPDLYSPTFCAHNRHKRSVTIDLTKPDGVAAFRRLAERSDVVVENFRPGVMDKLGTGYAELSKINPRLIYCAISGFGPTGPYRHRPAYDTVIQAISGLLGQVLTLTIRKSLVPTSPTRSVRCTRSRVSWVRCLSASEQAKGGAWMSRWSTP